ncbi:MAG: hypothetical protein ACFCBV_09245 [Phycisphaerales bacterium]
MPRIRPAALCLILPTACLGLMGCVADRPGQDSYGTVAGVSPLSALASQETLEAVEPRESVFTREGDVMDRRYWAPIALLAPNDLTLHTPHYTPSRLPTTGDWRYGGDVPNMLDVHVYGSGNRHQLKSLAYEPFLQVYDLVMIPVLMITGTPPNRLDASPDTEYVRSPDAWDTPLPRTGLPVGAVGMEVISRPAEGRQL